MIITPELWTPGQLSDGARAREWLRRERQKERQRWREVYDAPFPWRMVPTVLDAPTTSGSIVSFPANTQDYTPIVSAGAFRCIVAAANWQNTVIATAITTAQAGGRTLSAGTSLFATGGIGVQLYYLLESEIAQMSGALLHFVWNDTPDRALIGYISFTGVGSINNATGTTGNASAAPSIAPTSSANDMAIAAIISTDNNIAHTAGTDTVRYNVQSGHGYGMATAPGSGATTMTWAITNGDSYAIAAMNLVAAAGQVVTVATLTVISRPFPYAPSSPRGRM